MTRDELSCVIRRSLSEEMFNKPGSILFSGVGTIKPARFYVMGLNPGGSSEVLKASIVDTLAPEDGVSPYTHECWNKACTCNCDHIVRARQNGGRLAESDLVKHQKNMVGLSRLLGYDTPADLPSANAIFARSCHLSTLKKESGFGVQDWWKACWPVHQHLLGIVRPEIIISLGYGMKTSPLGLLAYAPDVEMRHPTGGSRLPRGQLINVSIRVESGKLDTRVIGVPHPSYRPIGSEITSVFRALV